MLKLRVTNIEVSDGTSLPVPEVGVVLFVGPNNAGKSQALRDIIGHARPSRPYIGKALPIVEFDKQGGPEEASSWLEQNLTKVRRDGVERVHVPGWGEVSPSDVVQQWASGYPDYLTDSFFLHADGTTRLSAGGAQSNVDFRSQFPTHPIQRAFLDPSLESEFSAISEAAFGRSLIVDRYAGSVILLRVGARPDFEHTNGVPTRAYLDALAKLPALEEQGDGVKSFLGLMIQLLAGSHQVLLIDEPEAFLHPPQARLLGRMLAQRASGQQVFIATHSADIVQGALEGGNSVTIVRLTREDDFNHAAILDHAALMELWSDPLLRYSDVLTGLFHDAVVVCESDADCRYYSAVRDHLKPEQAGNRRKELLFTHCGGKTRLHTVVQALTAVRVPVIVVADFDILRDASDLSRVLGALGADWDIFAGNRKVLDAALNSETRQLRRTTVGDAISSALGSMEEVLSARDIQLLRSILKADSGWDKVKRSGLAGAPQGDAGRAARQLVDDAKSFGLFIVPVGELERFEPTVGGHGPSWVNEVLAQHLHESPSAETTTFLTEIEDRVRQV